MGIFSKIFKKKSQRGNILVTPQESTQFSNRELDVRQGSNIQIVGESSTTTSGGSVGGGGAGGRGGTYTSGGTTISQGGTISSTTGTTKKSGGGGSSYTPTAAALPTTTKVGGGGDSFTGKVDVFSPAGVKEETKYYSKGKEAGRLFSVKGEQYAETKKGVKSASFTFDTQGGTKREVVELGGDTEGAKVSSEYEMPIGETQTGIQENVIVGDFDTGLGTQQLYGGTTISSGFEMPSDVKQHYEAFGIMKPGTIYSYQSGTTKSGIPVFETKTIGEDWSSRRATREEQLILNPLTEKSVGGGAYTAKGEYLYSGGVSSPLDWKGVFGETGKKVKGWASQELPFLNKVETKIETWELKEGKVLTKSDRQFLGGIATGIIPSTKGELVVMGGTTALGFGLGGVSASLGIGGKGVISKIIGGGMIGAYGIGTGIRMKMEPDISMKGEILGRSARDFGLFAYGYKGGFKTFIPRTEIIPLREGKIPTFKEEIYNIVKDDKLYRIGKYEIGIEKQPPRVSVTTTKFREYFDMKPLEVKYLPQVTSKVTTPFGVVNEEPFTTLEMKPRSKIGKWSGIEGQSKEFTLQTDIYGASNVEKYLVRGLGEYKTGGVPLPSSEKELVSFFNKNKMRFLSDIQSTKYFKMDIGKKPIEVNLEPLGRRTSRFQALTEITPIKETDVFSLSKADIVFKDVTMPFSRASGKTPAMKGVTLEWNEPIILEGNKDVGFIRTSGNKHTPFSDTFQKQIQEQKYIPTIKPPIRTPPARIVTQELQPQKLVSSIVSPSLVSVQKGFSQENLGRQISRTPFMERDISTNAYSMKDISVNLYKNLGKEMNKNISKELNKSMNINIEKNINKEFEKEISKNVQKEMQKTMQKQMQKNIQKNTLRNIGWGFNPRGTNKPPRFLIPRGKLIDISGFARGERKFVTAPTFGTSLGYQLGFDLKGFGEGFTAQSGLVERKMMKGIKLPQTFAGGKILFNKEFETFPKIKSYIRSVI